MEIVHTRAVDLTLHDAAGLIPPMRPEEWQVFLADVRENGVLEPLVIQRENVILDGRHRWQAALECNQATIPARVSLANEADGGACRRERWQVVSARRAGCVGRGGLEDA